MNEGDMVGSFRVEVTGVWLSQIAGFETVITMQVENVGTGEELWLSITPDHALGLSNELRTAYMRHQERGEEQWNNN